MKITFVVERRTMKNLIEIVEWPVIPRNGEVVWLLGIEYVVENVEHLITGKEIKITLKP